jgi:hypothetical protein
LVHPKIIKENNMQALILKMIKPYLLNLIYLKVIEPMRKLAKKTDNTLDDEMVNTIEAMLIHALK